MILSDRSLREQIEAGRIVIDPFDERCVQPSSIDVKIGNLFRVFRNHTSAVIDVKQNQEDLTELITIPDDGVFMLHPGEFVLGSTLERIAVPDDLVSRIEGKALAVATEIPTPDGFRAMGDLRPGDLVFSDVGAPVRVVAVSEVMPARPCREVTFSDRTTIIADADHQWVTTTKYERRIGREPTVRTTDEIGGTLMAGREYQHHVHLAGSVPYPQRTLPVEPYTFGIWLGDGSSTKAEITTADTEVLEALRAMGQLGNKHVPRGYLESSVAQRRSLLQGLMDSNGCVQGRGQAEFCSANENLAASFQELIASLGGVCSLTKDETTLCGVDCGPRFRVRAGSMLARSIRSVCEVPSVPVRCIQVDSPSGIFLATRSYIPTHNSSLGRLGLIIHSTAGFIDAGFDGHVTLELTNIATLPITLYPGMKIGQVSFMQMTTPADNPYGKGARGSKYQGQRGPTPSRYWENFR